MSKGSAVAKTAKSSLHFFSRDAVIAAFQQDVINAIRLKGTFSYRAFWHRGYVEELKRRGLSEAEIHSMEDIAVTAARTQVQLSHV